ncbi:hypothetical protein VC83_01433 [Pseudogymnoascus destructans]|uniref:Secreted protein n=1 Tax=Pseudogymnoascus destructans TaxID=655981 RepID=A0A177AJ23_9PEZI|nr:uncharacterized protein VC83_01433 [Pseudogymnoascus destructans]OAF62078.1 hypothetical protein VC83_01433 [Pseudogymnoascus destructans]
MCCALTSVSSLCAGVSAICSAPEYSQPSSRWKDSEHIGFPLRFMVFCLPQNLLGGSYEGTELPMPKWHLRKLRKKDVDDEEIANTLSMIVYTIKIENEMNTSSAYNSIQRCQRRRTEITIFTYVFKSYASAVVIRRILPPTSRSPYH